MGVALWPHLFFMEKAKKRFRFPMQVKTFLLVIILGLVLVETAMIFFSVTSKNSNEANAKREANNLSGVIANVIDVAEFKTLKNDVKSIVDASATHPLSDKMGTQEWNDYIAQFDGIKSSAAYINMRTYLQSLVSDYSKELSCIYLTYVDPVNKLFVYVVDAAPDGDECPPGCLDPIYSPNQRVLNDLTIGFPAYITNTTQYGYLVTAGKTVYDGSDVVGYAMCDISLNIVREIQKVNIIRLFIYLILATIGICIIAAVVVHFILIRPLRKLNDTAKAYDPTTPYETHEKFEKLNIKTHDEVHELAEAIKEMENDVFIKIGELTATSAKLEVSQNEVRMMSDLANKDALTGVKSKVVYNNDVRIINEEIASGWEVEFGVVMIDLNDLKVINDQFGHDNGDAALIQLTGIICNVFAHSPVYRFGGDEFVVLLRNDDYHHASKLIDEFNHRIEKLARNKKLTLPEKASASIG